LVNDLLDLGPGFYGCGDMDEFGGMEVGFHSEG
jgi:hypothetical protein